MKDPGGMSTGENTPIRIAPVSPSDFPDWDERLVRSGGPYSFFHSTAWAEVLSRAYGYAPRYFVKPEEGAFRTLIPMMEVASRLTGRRGVSLPFSDYCEAMLGEGAQREATLAAVSQHARDAGWRYMEFRGGPFPTETPFTFHYGHQLDLGRSREQLFAGLDGSVRRNIRRALRENITIEPGESEEAVTEFYRLNVLTRKEHGLPPQPYGFFREIQRRVLSRGKGFILLARHAGRAVAGAVFFHLGEKALYKFGASDRRLQHLRANNLVMWEAVALYAERGFATFCFGRTEPGNEGLRRFKLGWGTSERIIPYYRYDVGRGAFATGGPTPGRMPLGAVFRRLPVSILLPIGRLLYRHVG